MSLIASATALASEKSFVEGYFNSDHKITEDNNEHVIKKTGLKTEINTKNGLSFGLNLEGKDIKIPFEKYAYDNILNNSNIFIKYSIPEKNKVNSYLKATINPKVKRENDTPKYTTSNLELEGDLNISPFEKSKFGINSKTKFEFENDTENYGKHVTSTHKMYFDSKNIKASAEVSHNYDKDATKSLKFVKLNSEIDYDILSSKFNFKYQFNGVSKAKNLLNGDLITLESKDYIHSYEIDLKKKILDDKLELSAGAFIQHHYDNQIQLGDKYAKLSLQNDNDYKEMLKNETKAKKLLKEIEDKRKELDETDQKIENLKNEIYSKVDKTKKDEIDSQKKKIETFGKELEIKEKKEIDALNERTNSQIEFLRKNINDSELDNVLNEINSKHYDSEEDKLKEKSEKINTLYGNKSGMVENGKGQEKITQLIGKYGKSKTRKFQKDLNRVENLIYDTETKTLKRKDGLELQYIGQSVKDGISYMIYYNEETEKNVWYNYKFREYSKESRNNRECKIKCVKL